MKKFCANCKEPFQSQRRSRLYCCDRCKQQAFYKRNVLASTNHGMGIPLAGVSNALDTGHFNRSELVNRLTAILNDFIDQEIERRMGQPPYAATVSKPVNVKRNQTVSSDPENEPEYKDAGHENEYNAKEPHIVKRNVASNRNLDLTKNKPFNYKRNQTLNRNQDDEYADDEPENGDAGGEETSWEDPGYKDELSPQEAFNVKRDQTVNGNQDQDDEYAGGDKPENEDWSVNNEDELSTRELHNVKRDVTLNRIRDSTIRKPVNVTQFANDHEPANIEKPAGNGSFSNDQKIKSNSGIDENWVFSTFTRSIHEHDFYMTDTEFNAHNSRQVLEVFKCLVKHLLCLSNRKPVSCHNLIVLTEIFAKLRHSVTFQSLPSQFPYHAVIVRLTKKLQSLEKISRKQPVKLRLTLKFRTELYAILYAMDDNVNDIRIDQIRFDKPGLERVCALNLE